MIYVKRVRKGEETGTEEIFLEAMPFFPLLFLSSVPSPLGNRIFLSLTYFRSKGPRQWQNSKRPWFMLRGCGKGKRLGRKKYSLRPCLSFLCFSYRLSPPPSVTEYFSPWPISGQKVLDSDKTVYKDVLNNRLLCPPPAYPIANHFVVLYVFVFDHIQPTTLIIFDHKSWPHWIILDLYQS